MKKWLIYLLGIITGFILTLALAFSINSCSNSNIDGLELFDEPGDYMEYAEFEVFQVVDSGCALAFAGVESYDAVVFIMPNENQQFYDSQKIVLKKDQCAQRVGTYKYRNNQKQVKTVPAIKIVDGVALSNSKTADNENQHKILFDEPGECLSKKNFKVKEVLESGDAIALEISSELSDEFVLTSDLEVLILAQEDSNFYNNQIIKMPQGKCARQIGNYKYSEYSINKVIPIIAFQ